MNEIIEGFNRYIEERRKESGINAKGHLVLLKRIDPTIVNAYKTLVYELYFVGKTKKLVISFSSTSKITSDKEKECLDKETAIGFSMKLVGLTDKDKEAMVYGTYGD